VPAAYRGTENSVMREVARQSLDGKERQQARMQDITAYAGLFMAAFLAATLIPAQSESVLTGLLLAGGQSPLMLVAVASLGNVLGSVLNWLIGRCVERFRERRWFPASQTQLERAQAQYQRFGYWSLLMAWVPIIGDPLTLVAGIMREPLWRFLILVSIGKVGRYAVIAAGFGLLD
jgi:membrane protein YqaA with SNARE-associated domain